MIFVQKVTYHVDHVVRRIVVMRPFSSAARFLVIFALVSILAALVVSGPILCGCQGSDDINFHSSLPSVCRLVLHDFDGHKLARLNMQTSEDLGKGPLPQKRLYPEVGRRCALWYLASRQNADLFFGNMNVIIFVDNEIPFYVITKTFVGNTF